MAQSTRQVLLENAVKKFGRKEVARRLSTSEDTIRVWLDGNAGIPERKVLILIDLLDQEQSPPR